MKMLMAHEESLGALAEHAEAGMDFHVVSGNVEGHPDLSTFAIRSGGQVLSLDEHDDVYSMSHLMNGEALPRNTEVARVTGIVAKTGGTTVTLAPGSTTKVGAHPLLGALRLGADTTFFRLTSHPNDFRFSGGTLASGTYLTTSADRLLVNTGFGAVGRYSLPLPVPAVTLHQYLVPKNTRLSVGTVAPQFGQSGGGVEVMTRSAVSGVVKTGTLTLPEC